MADKKTKVYTVEPPEYMCETADRKFAVRRVLKPDALGNNYAACRKCGCRLVNVEERIRCKYCWNCGTPVRWK